MSDLVIKVGEFYEDEQGRKCFVAFIYPKDVEETCHLIGWYEEEGKKYPDKWRLKGELIKKWKEPRVVESWHNFFTNGPGFGHSSRADALEAGALYPAYLDTRKLRYTEGGKVEDVTDE